MLFFFFILNFGSVESKNSYFTGLLSTCRIRLERDLRDNRMQLSTRYKCGILQPFLFISTPLDRDFIAGGYQF